MKKIIKLLLILIFLAGLVAGGVYLWYNNGINSPNSSSTELKHFNIALGSSIDKIASDLQSAGLIKDKNLFWIYSKLNPADVNAIQAGDYNLPMNLNIPDMYKALHKAIGKEDIKVVVLEGLRYDEVVNSVSQSFAGSTTFDKSEMTNIIEHPDNYTFSSDVQTLLDTYKPRGINLEGFLFPDTYYFYKDATAKDVIEKLIKTLFQKLTTDDLNKIKNSNYSLHEYLIVASYLEKEANTHSTLEMGMVSDIIFKRLERGVEGVSSNKFLQLDATLAYPERDWKINVYPLKTKDTPYNTFMHAGLTPTPINNPGIATIRGAINRVHNDYYYYIYDLKGDIYYAKTYSEHVRNANKYL